MIDDQPAIAVKMLEMPSPLKNAIMRADLEEELKSLQDAGVPEAGQMAIGDCPTCQRTESEKGKNLKSYKWDNSKKGSAFCTHSIFRSLGLVNVPCRSILSSLIGYLEAT